MWRRGDLGLLHLWPICILSLTLFLGVCGASGWSENKFLIKFILAIDPKNLLEINWDRYIPDHCSDMWKGIKCDMLSINIVEIRLENLKLSGMIDADSLCNLPSLRVLSLATNLISGSIPDSISNCASLTNMNLSSNMLHGAVPASLNRLKNLRSLDISNNNLAGSVPRFNQEIELVYPNSMESSTLESTNNVTKRFSDNRNTDHEAVSPTMEGWVWLSTYTALLLLIIFIFLFIFIKNKKLSKATKEKESKECIQEAPEKIVTVEMEDYIEKEAEASDLIFFGNEHERFNKDDLLSSAADLQGQSIHSSLYKVCLKSNAIFAVKRLRRLHLCEDDFRRTINWIGNLKHPNLLPLLAYHSSGDETLLIYRYQRSGSLSSLLSSHEDGKRDFPWRQRLSIMSGIARGLNYIARESSCKDSVPHGNLKPSNILLSENEEPLISEYGIWSFLDPKRALLYSCNRYRAPEKNLTDKADIFSFGVILLELLTGKAVENSSLDLPKWVKSMVREEWTGEVFDREVNRVGRQWAFPLLNIALKCVSHLPEKRPDISEVLEKIEHVVNSQEDCSFSSSSSSESNLHDASLIHTVIPEISESPGNF